MKLIDTKTHGVLDYLMGILLIALPFLMAFDTEQPESIILFVLGASALVYSLVTDYELGLFRMLPMRVHLGLDVMSGLLLAASPWLFGFSDRVYLPHLILGIIEVMAGLMTRTRTRTD